jgi:hypothetical protein
MYPMMIIQAVREAGTPEEIYLLLTAYVRGTRLGDELKSVPRQLTALPLSDPDDVKAMHGLFNELGTASKGLDDVSRTMIKEALYVFTEGLKRLLWLNNTRGEDRDLRTDPRPDLDRITERSDVPVPGFRQPGPTQ